jgi:hypothetical protein
LGCGHSGAADAAAPAGDAGAAPGTRDAAPDDHCTPPDGVATSPRSIADVTAFLNALPKPVALPCFVESLPRPLAMQAVESQVSAQPAVGRRSPRMFLFWNGLTMSVVPAGMGQNLLELGEERGDDRSLKAELEFPIEEHLDAAAPFARVHYDDTITTCGFCHQGEERADGVDSPNAYVSPALRPEPWQRVPLDELQSEVADCDADAEPERCALLHALFDQRPAPVEHDFPMTYPTFM